jgi:hypothetical protein
MRMATKALISADAALLSSGLQILDQIRDHLRLEYGPEGLSEDHMIDQMAVAIFKSTRFNSAESGIFHTHVKSYLDRTRDEQSSSAQRLHRAALATVYHRISQFRSRAQPAP